jgi:3-dehydroquinate synthase
MKIDANDIVLLDSKFGEINGLPNSEKIIRIKSGEDVKTVEEAGRILNLMADQGLNKDSKIIAIGGGTVQDIATFTASIYMRGIRWIFIPTTLQAMADSCIGGKSAINVGNYKNLIGNFHPPSQVLIDARLIQTLSFEDITCGLIEALKIAFAFGEESTNALLKLITDNNIQEESNSELYESIIEISLLSKKYFVEVDEFDRKERKKLNFGHTYGHAIEASTRYNIHHGLAVGVGVLASFVHREESSILPIEENLIMAVRKLLRPYKTLLSKNIGNINQNDFFRFIQLDKKLANGEMKFVHSKNGDLEIVSLPNSEITYKDAFKSVMEATNAI